MTTACDRALTDTLCRFYLISLILGFEFELTLIQCRSIKLERCFGFSMRLVSVRVDEDVVGRRY